MNFSGLVSPNFSQQYYRITWCMLLRSFLVIPKVWCIRPKIAKIQNKVRWWYILWSRKKTVGPNDLTRLQVGLTFPIKCARELADQVAGKSIMWQNAKNEKQKPIMQLMIDKQTNKQASILLSEACYIDPPTPLYSISYYIFIYTTTTKLLSH